MKYTDPSGVKQVAQGDIGQLQALGPKVFNPHWQMPEKTAEQRRVDGYFITVDPGLIDSDGCVTIVGRNKKLIISSGYNIYPKEIELILDAQSGVPESAVFGVLHLDLGESVLGLSVVESGEEISPDVIMQALKEQPDYFKQPKKSMIKQGFLRNTRGKLQMYVLRDQSYDTFA